LNLSTIDTAPTNPELSPQDEFGALDDDLTLEEFVTIKTKDKSSFRINNNIANQIGYLNAERDYFQKQENKKGHQTNFKLPIKGKKLKWVF
jgi:hypothetical protein